MLRLFILIVLLVVGEAHAASCPPTTDFELRVTPVYDKVKTNLTTSFAEIERLAGPETAARHYPLLGMALQGVGAAHAVHVNATENGGRFCAGLKAVEIRVGFVDRTVFIAKEAVANDCLYREAMAHQMSHLAHDDKALEMFVPVFARERRQILQGIALGPATTSEAARRTLTDTVVALSRGFLPSLEQEQLRLRQQLESSAELDRIRNACGGLGQRLNEL